VGELTLPDAASVGYPEVSMRADSLTTALQEIENLVSNQGSDAPAGFKDWLDRDRHSHPGELCPVCGGKPLDDAWAVRTRAEIDRLRHLAADAESAERFS
jgi:hypothetical protein